MIRRRGNAKVIVLVVLAVIGTMMLSCAGLVALVVFPALGQARLAAQRMQSSNNMKMIALALHNYQDTYGTLPPAYIPDEDGKPMHSWRTLLLPFVEENYLYDQYDFDQPWNSPANLQLASTTPWAYTNPAMKELEDQGLTTYVALAGPKTAINTGRGVKLSEVMRGAPNRVMVVEDTSNPVPWSQPTDISPEAFLAKDFSQQVFHGVLVGNVDGSVRFVAEDQKGELQGLVTTDDLAQ
ncbi:DUF1559 domain-containing protein [Bremerella cremea]|uniref:DUF1559 family PulG-like putative transporter n=1 Tax=Bremerella cremea TaxID=1031537 RepID=UPI0031E99828